MPRCVHAHGPRETYGAPPQHIQTHGGGERAVQVDEQRPLFAVVAFPLRLLGQVEAGVARRAVLVKAEDAPLVGERPFGGRL